MQNRLRKLEDSGVIVGYTLRLPVAEPTDSRLDGHRGCRQYLRERAARASWRAERTPCIRPTDVGISSRSFARTASRPSTGCSVEFARSTASRPAKPAFCCHPQALSEMLRRTINAFTHFLVTCILKLYNATCCPAPFQNPPPEIVMYSAENSPATASSRLKCFIPCRFVLRRHRAADNAHPRYRAHRHR